MMPRKKSLRRAPHGTSAYAAATAQALRYAGYYILAQRARLCFEALRVPCRYDGGVVRVAEARKMSERAFYARAKKAPLQRCAAICSRAAEARAFDMSAHARLMPR